MKYSYYLYIFIISAFLGFVLETIWCIIKNGHFESRKGLIYEYLSPIYGFAALCITLCINKFKIKSKLKIFIVGTIISTIIEYLGSFLQEHILGTKSWDYSGFKFNLKGRINLLYSLFFGIATLFFKILVLDKYNIWFMNTKGTFLQYISVFLTIFLIFDISISLLACFRMREREQGIKRECKFWQFIDDKYTSDRLMKIYANMRFI